MSRVYMSFLHMMFCRLQSWGAHFLQSWNPLTFVSVQLGFFSRQVYFEVHFLPYYLLSSFKFRPQSVTESTVQHCQKRSPCLNWQKIWLRMGKVKSWCHEMQVLRPQSQPIGTRVILLLIQSTWLTTVLIFMMFPPSPFVGPQCHHFHSRPIGLGVTFHPMFCYSPWMIGPNFCTSNNTIWMTSFLDSTYIGLESWHHLVELHM